MVKLRVPRITKVGALNVMLGAVTTGLDFPALATIDTILIMQGGGFTDLSGLSALRSAKDIQISNSSALTSLAGWTASRRSARSRSRTCPSSRRWAPGQPHGGQPAHDHGAGALKSLAGLEKLSQLSSLSLSGLASLESLAASASQGRQRQHRGLAGAQGREPARAGRGRRQPLDHVRARWRPR